MQFYRIKGGGGAAPPPPPSTDNFIMIKVTSANCNHWKGNLMPSRINSKYWRNIIISQLYEQFSRNDSEMIMTPELLSEKNSKLLKYEHII